MISASRTPGGKVRLFVSGFTEYSKVLPGGYAFDLTPAQVEVLIEQLQAGLEGHVVRVSFLPGSASKYSTTAEYCYIDPSGTVKVGDLVEVPTKFAASNIAKVVGIGRLGYTGSLSDVIAKLERAVVAPEAPF